MVTDAGPGDWGYGRLAGESLPIAGLSIAQRFASPARR